MVKLANWKCRHTQWAHTGDGNNFWVVTNSWWTHMSLRSPPQSIILANWSAISSEATSHVMLSSSSDEQNYKIFIWNAMRMHHSVGYHHSYIIHCSGQCALTIHLKFSGMSKSLYPVVRQLISSQYNIIIITIRCT